MIDPSKIIGDAIYGCQLVDYGCSPVGRFSSIILADEIIQALGDAGYVIAPVNCSQVWVDVWRETQAQGASFQTSYTRAMREATK